MDLQTKKLYIIEHVIQLQDDQIIQEIEDLIVESNSHDKNPQLLTDSDLLQRANESNVQYKAKEFIDQADLEEKSKSW